MRIRSRLETIKNADRLVEVLRLSDELAAEVARDGGVNHARLLVKAIRSEDQITAIAAIHALARVPDETADTSLAEMLSDGRGFVREHAAWALSSRAPRAGVVARLTGLVVTGGFTGMLAQRTLEEWAAAASDIVAVGLESALIGITSSSQRYRLVETLGLVQQPAVTVLLQRIAANTAEGLMVRVAAVAALGDRGVHPATRDLLERLACEGGGRLAEVAQLALVDLNTPAQTQQELADDRHSSLTAAARERKRGLTVAQLFLHADINPELSHAGSGDNGGIATLLVRLGDALVGERDRLGDEISVDGVHTLPVTRVLTLSRGAVHEALQSLESLGDRHLGHLYARVPLLQEDVQSANAWPLRIAARRGVARIVRSAGTVDVIHLRMADVGSLAALEVARAQNIPVVFTSAPDPHGLIHSMDRSGALTRENFGTVDEIEHFWFRARLLQRLVVSSTHTVYFPRPNLRLDVRELMGIDIANAPGKHTTVPEGIDLSVTDEAVSEASDLASGGGSSAALRDLRDLCEGLPPERRGLPLLVSVGRFHRVKGTATVVEAWAGSELRERSNLLLVGGNLQHPSADEQEQLDRIQQVIGRDQQMSQGLMLAGHRPNGVVSRWIAAARFGMPGFVAPNGVYVCGSLKEEFGLAVLEAMAAGLLVVAPDGGGPATYVEQGRTGFLTTTWDPTKLREAIGDALDSAAAEHSDERARHSRRVVEERFTVEAMAEALMGVYSGAHHDDMTLKRELDVTL
jgi:glycosyltransferase involved in cell wall biosynthesis